MMTQQNDPNLDPNPDRRQHMMTQQNDPNLDPNLDPANDNGGAIAPASRANALASTALTALAATFKNVDTTSIGGRPTRPILQFKSREGGIFVFGTRRTIPEPDSLWAVNPASFRLGWVCWGDGTKPLGERLVSIGEPLPDVTQLPDKGFPWQQGMAVDLKCVSGTDAGTEVVFKTNTEGGKGEVIRLIEAVRDRLNGGQHDDKVSPIVRLENSSYPHPQYGKTWIPVLPVADWMSLDGPPPVSEPVSPPPTEQPRRRRVG
jgi:hypothetical protein